MKSPIEVDGLSSYTVLPGKLFAGQYPGARDPEIARNRVAAFIKAGISSFVDLTHPHDGLQPYGSLLAGEVQRRNYPVYDMSVPRHRFEMSRILNGIDASLNSGHITYIHCWGGRGRTGVVVACWLIRHGMRPEEALTRVADLWAPTPRALMGYRSPETREQIEFVRSWAEPDSSEVGAWERSRGALVGLAVGDAVGSAVEFKPRGSFPEVTDMLGGGPHRLRPGEWTDDTSMALCLAESLIATKQFDPSDQMRRYVNWWKNGYLSSTGRCFDIGITISAALSRFQRTKEPFSGSSDPFTAGNGSIMRLAPVPIRYWRSLAECIQLSAESSKTTHAARTCLDACRLLGAMLARAIGGEDKESILRETIKREELGDLCPEIRAIGEGSFLEKEESEIAGNGYVVSSLEAALWSIHRTRNFREAVLLATNLGEDADTTAAIVGQLAGAIGGEMDIPAEWLRRLAMTEHIERLADQLCSLAAA